MKVFDAPAIADRLPPAALADALRHRLAAADVALPVQQSLPLATDPAGARLLLSAAGTPGRRFLVRTTSLAAGGAAPRGRALLFDADGTPLAQFDAPTLAAHAAAATAALAADRLARPDADRLALLGAGRLASAIAAALRALRPLREVVVWSRHDASAQELAAELADAGIAARTAPSAGAAVEGATLVAGASAATAPVLQGAWLGPGAFVALLGAVLPGQQEADAEVAARAGILVDGEAALAERLRDAAAPAPAGDALRLFRSTGSPRAELVAAEFIADAPARPRPLRWYWEDFPVGQVRDCGRVQVRREDILAFAQQFDPQPFHLDDAAAARSLFGSLSASGWHTCAMAMRRLCDGYLLESASLGSPGIENLRWHRPVLAGDRLAVRMTVLAARPMASKPGVGLMRNLWEVHNQRDELVMSMEGWGMMRRRTPAAG